MRLRNLILWDIRFQAKYGFYFLYAVLTVLYVVLLFALPMDLRRKAATILIFSDPAAMGMFFMGAVILLEKSQKIPCAFAVSPVKAAEYILAEVISFGAISEIVALVIAVAAGVSNLPGVLIGTLFSSVMFTLLGMIVAAKIKSLNQFVLGTVPFEIICFVPAILYLFGMLPEWMQYVPQVWCMGLIAQIDQSIMGIVWYAMLILLLLFVAYRNIERMWNSMGGAKL